MDHDLCERGGGYIPASVTGTSLSSATNSTPFTNCCGLAVVRGQEKCDGCGLTIHPHPYA